MNDILLRVQDIRILFGPIKALDGVGFELRKGEIHGLVGENGSGKSTLTSIMAGILQHYEGTMEKSGLPYRPLNVVNAQELGVSMVVQEMGTVPELSVAENIFLGKERLFSKLGIVHKKKMIKSASEALENIGELTISPAIPVGMLSFEDRKIVELAKAMVDKPSVFILDETTTAISMRGRTLMYAVMEKLRQEEKGVVFITHDLEELMTVCTKLTVLRDGKIIGSLNKDEFSVELIRSMMVGREIKDNMYRVDYDATDTGEAVLSAENLCGAEVIENVNIELRKGEILGIGGLSDSGMHELGRLLFGLDKAISGRVRLADGTLINNPEVAVDNGIGYVSKNRDQEALMLRASIRDNIVASALKKKIPGHLISPKTENRLADDMVRELAIKCASHSQQVRFLSGGNKQKVVFSKWIGNDSKILILDCPTRGVDIGVKCAMYDLIVRLKADGCSIVLISEELQELLGMSDRILIIKDGRVEREYGRSASLSEHDLIESMI